MSSSRNNRIDHLIQFYSAHAKWHLQQYKNYCYYARYYHSLKQTELANHPSQSNVTDSSCGYYFTKGKNQRKRRNKRRIAKQLRKRRNNQNDPSTSMKDNVEVAEQMESDGSEYELDKGFQDFLRQSAEFRKERGLIFVLTY